jgi:ferritin-like metal-binding protein YciE
MWRNFKESKFVEAAKKFYRLWRQINKQTNKQLNKHTNKQLNKHTNKQLNKHTNKQLSLLQSFDIILGGKLKDRFHLDQIFQSSFR